MGRDARLAVLYELRLFFKKNDREKYTTDELLNLLDKMGEEELGYQKVPQKGDKNH